MLIVFTFGSLFIVSAGSLFAKSGCSPRIGLKTIESKKNTALRVKPIGKVQWNFKAYYLYGAVAPQTGETFW